ncbi:MAG: FAD-dependent oxidoreductase [Alphaproteobacteria bacterium]
MTKKTPSPFSPSAQSGRGPRENRTRRNAPTLETPAAGNSGTGSSGPGNSGPRNSGSGALKRCDIVIAGGGMVGLTLAIALGQSGLKVVIIDRDTPERLTAADADGRASAIAYGSQRLLDVLGIWPRIKEIGPIREIRVADGKLAGPQGGLTAAELFIHYDVAELHPKTTLRSHGSSAAIAKPRANVRRRRYGPASRGLPRGVRLDG